MLKFGEKKGVCKLPNLLWSHNEVSDCEPDAIFRWLQFTNIITEIYDTGNH